MLCQDCQCRHGPQPACAIPRLRLDEGGTDLVKVSEVKSMKNARSSDPFATFCNYFQPATVCHHVRLPNELWNPCALGRILPCFGIAWCIGIRSLLENLGGSVYEQEFQSKKIKKMQLTQLCLFTPFNPFFASHFVRT